MKFLETICALLLLATVDARFKEQHRPCTFNPLCTCSNGGPDLGSVSCHNIPFMTIPPQINHSAIYIMSLKYNKLRFLLDNSLNGTGLWKLQINNNLLTDIPSNALVGLEKTLSILDLSENELVRIPKEAIQNLEKLYNLHLAGNHISFFRNEDLRGVHRTLKVLDLSDNAIIHINNDAFANMTSLEVLNLAFNAIISIDDVPFQSSMENLRLLNLMGNQLQQIPLNTIAGIKNLKIVNLNENLITYISEGSEVRSRINLEELHLENNLIEELTKKSFRVFYEVDRIYLKGNPITELNDTFLTINVTEIYLQHCQISDITKNAFKSVTQSLKVLDLSYNDLDEFPSLPLNKLNKLFIAGNEINTIEPKDVESFKNTLKYLDIRIPKIKISQDLWKSLPNLRELVINKQQSTLNAHSFANVSPSIEKLSVIKGSVNTIENGAFQQLTGLKTLDLSHNTISRIGESTFKEVGHSLDKLLLHAAIKMSGFPTGALHHLLKLQYLDMSGNHIERISPESLTTFHYLKHLNLNHNNIKHIDPNLVSGIYNPNLIQLKLAFNKLSTLRFHTFKDLQNLIYLQLNDNLIRRIEKSAFFNLDSLISIELEGNTIEQIDDEAFQNLPNIQYISLSYNRLTTLNLEAFDQVGRLSTLKIDVDHNEIQNLTSNFTSSHSSSNIKSINLSHNNISYLESNYFDPIRLSITLLDLSHNCLSNLTNFAFVDMTHLQTLILSNNLINLIQEEELKGLRNLQILDMSENNLEELPEKVFAEQRELRIFSVAHNGLQTLPKKIFVRTELEQLDLSYNEFAEFPVAALLGVKDTIQYLDLTGNEIRFLNFSSIKHLQNLRHFSIAQNGLHLPPAVNELEIPKLISLDLSHNAIQDLPEWILDNLPKSLESLNLANTSLKTVPIFDACNILQLNLSYNTIQSIPAEALEQLKRVQILDFSNNLLPTIYNNLWSNLQQLRSLYLQMNPIQSISNRTFSNMERLQELFIKNLKLQDIQKEAFHQLAALKKIEMDTYPKIKTTNLTQLLSKNNALKELHLHVQENDLDGILHGNIPKSLKYIILEGENLRSIDESAFVDIQSQTITLDIRNTNITSLSKKLFENMREVKNFSASFTNNKLQKVERVITSFEKEGMDKNLKQLELTGNRLHCSCELGWIWEWIKEYEHQNECRDIPCDESYLEDLREVKCINMNNKPIINVFKTDLNCFSRATSTIINISRDIFFIMLICFTSIILM